MNRHYGPIMATIDPQARRVTFRVKRDRREDTRLTRGEMSRLAAWAMSGIADFERQGYEIDRAAILEYLA